MFILLIVFFGILLWLYFGLEIKRDYDLNNNRIRERLSYYMMLEEYRAVESYKILYSKYFTKQELYDIEKWLSKNQQSIRGIK